MTDREEELRHMIALLDRMANVSSTSDESALIDKLANVSAPTVVAFLNQHGMNVAFKSPMFRDHLLGVDYLLRDGVGVELAMLLLGRRPGINLNGTDFIPKLLLANNHRNVAVIGTRDPWLSRGVARMQSQGVSVTAWMDGFRDDDEYVDEMRRTQPGVILLAMGMPRQESVAAKLASALSHPCLIINGGAIVDFYGGRFPRAPAWARKLRLEWAYRLFKEPGRLWSRYVIGGGFFAWNLLRMRRASGSRA